MIKKLIALLFLVCSFSASAVTITIGKGLGAGVNVQSAGGSFLSTGSFSIAVGTFTTLPDASASGIASVLSSFSEFGRATSNVSAGEQGLVALTSGVTAAPTNAADFNTKSIYLVIGNSTTLEQSTEYAVITGLNPAAGTWVFPANVQAAGSVSAPMNDASRFQVLIGGKVDNATGVDTLVLVPEAGSASLMMLSLGTLLMRRRR